MENAREFLQKGSYKDPKDVKDLNFDKKKQSVTRTIAGKEVKFDIMADPNQITKDKLW